MEIGSISLRVAKDSSDVVPLRSSKAAVAAEAGSGTGTQGAVEDAKAAEEEEEEATGPRYFIDISVTGLRVACNAAGVLGGRIELTSLAVDDFLSDTVQNRIVRLGPLPADDPLLAASMELPEDDPARIGPATGLRYESTPTQTIVTVAHCDALASASMQRSLSGGRLVTIPEGFEALPIPPRKNVEEAEKKKAKQTPPRPDVPGWIARTKRLRVLCPETYRQRQTRALSIAFDEGCFYPMMLDEEDHVAYSGTMCEFGNLNMDVVWMLNGLVDPDFAAKKYAPMLCSADPLTFSMKVSRDYENLDWTWQWPRLDASGKVEGNLTTQLFADFDFALCAVMRHWAYDKYSVDEPRHWEFDVGMMGPWMVTSDEGVKKCDSDGFVPFTVSHPEVLHWGWYNCLRFDAAEGELCPFYMHLNPLSHVAEATPDLLPEGLLPEGADRELVLAYVVPQDGLGAGSTKDYFVAFIQCPTAAVKVDLFTRVTGSLRKERESPIIYRNRKHPLNTWSNQRYAAKEMRINFRENRDQIEPVSTIAIPDFAYTQVNRQHDWEINVWCDAVHVYGRDPPPLPHGIRLSSGTKPAHSDLRIASLRPPAGKSLVQYNIIHTAMSPLCEDGLPKYSTQLRLDTADVSLIKGPTLLAVKKYFTRMGVEFGDAYSVMWQLTLIENGGVQRPLDPDSSGPLSVTLGHLKLTVADATHSLEPRQLLELTADDVVYATTWRARREKTMTLNVGSLAATAEGVDVLKTRPPGASSRPKAVRRKNAKQGAAESPSGSLARRPGDTWLKLHTFTDLAYHDWNPTQLTVGSRTEATVGPVDLVAPMPKTVRRLKRFGDFPAVEPSTGLWERTTRMAGAREGRRAAAAEEHRREQLTKGKAMCALTNATVASLTATADEGSGFDGDASVVAALADVVVATRIENGSMGQPAVHVDANLRHFAINTVHAGRESAVLEPVVVKAQLVQRWSRLSDTDATMVSKGGWRGSVDTNRLDVSLDTLQYPILLNTVATHTPKEPKQRRKKRAQVDQPPAEDESAPEAPKKSFEGHNFTHADIKLLIAGIELQLAEHRGPGIMRMRFEPITTQYRQSTWGDLDVTTPQLRFDAVELDGRSQQNVVLLYGDANDLRRSESERGTSPKQDGAAAAPDGSSAAGSVVPNTDLEPLLAMATKAEPNTSQTNLHLAPLAVLATPQFIGRVVGFTRVKREREAGARSSGRHAAARKRRGAYDRHFANQSSTKEDFDGAASVAGNPSLLGVPGLTAYHNRTASAATAPPAEDGCARSDVTSDSAASINARSDAGSDASSEGGLEELVNGVAEGDTCVTDATFAIKSDGFLCPSRRLLFNRPGGTVVVDGCGNTLFLGHHGAPVLGSSVPTPDAVHWNIVVGVDTTVELHNVTLNVDEAWRGLIHMSRGGRLNAHRANGAYIEVVKDEVDDDDRSDMSDSSDLGGSMSLGEIDNAAVEDGDGDALSGSPTFDHMSIDDVESTVSVSRFVASTKDHKTNVVVERVMIGATTGVAGGAADISSAPQVGELTVAVQLGLIADYNTRNTPYGLGASVRLIGTEVRLVGTDDFTSCAVGGESIAGLGGPVLSPVDITADVFGDKSDDRERFMVAARVGGLGIHASSRRIHALQAVAAQFQAAMKATTEAGDAPLEPKEPPPPVNSEAKRQDPLGKEKPKTTHVVKFELDAGRIVTTWYESPAGRQATARSAIARRAIAASTSGKASSNTAAAPRHDHVDLVVAEPPVARVALDAVQFVGKSHLPAATFLTTGQLMLTADVFNERSFEYEPLLEEAGFGISARKVQVSRNKFSTIATVVGINALDVTIASTYVTRLQAAYSSATAAFAPAPTTARTLAQAGSGSLTGIANSSLTGTKSPRTKGPGTPSGGPASPDWESSAAGLSVGTYVRNRMGVPVTIAVAGRRVVVEPTGEDMLIDDNDVTAIAARVGVRADHKDSAGGEVPATDCFGPFVPVSLRDGRRQYLPFRTTGGHEAQRAKQEKKRQGAVTEEDLFEDKSVRFAVLAIAPDGGKNVATFTSPLTFLNFTTDTLDLHHIAGTADVVSKLEPDAEPTVAPTDVLDAAWYIGFPSRKCRSAKRGAMHTVAKKETKSFALHLYSDGDAAAVDAAPDKADQYTPVSTVMITVAVSFVPNRDRVAERVVTFDVPIVLHNLLPFSLDVLLSGDHKGEHVRHDALMAPSARDALYCGSLESTMHLGARMCTPQGALLHPLKMVELDEGDRELVFVDGLTGGKFRMTVEVAYSDATAVVSIYSPYLLMSGYPTTGDAVQYHLDDDFVPGTVRGRWAGLPYAFGAEKLKDVPEYAKHPLSKCVTCGRRLVRANQRRAEAAVVQCERTGRLAHFDCADTAPTDCLTHVNAVGKPTTNSRRRSTSPVQNSEDMLAPFADGATAASTCGWEQRGAILVFSPPSFDPFGGKLKVSVGRSDASKPFPYDAVNVDGAVMCRESDPDDPDTLRVRTVGVSLRLGPGQYVKSKVVFTAPFFNVANSTADLTLRIVVDGADVVVAELPPKSVRSPDLVLPRQFATEKKIVKEGKWPLVALQVLSRSPEGDRLVVHGQTPAFDMAALGDINLKAKPLIDTAPAANAHGEAPNVVDATARDVMLCCMTTVVGPTLRVSIARATAPPIRIVNHTWSRVEFQQANNKAAFTRPHALNPFQATPYFFDDSGPEAKRNLMLRVADGGYTVRLKPMSVESTGAGEDFDVVGGSAGRFRFVTLVGYDSIVVAVEEHYPMFRTAVHCGADATIELAKPAESELNVRLAFKYGGETRHTAPVKIAKGQRIGTIPAQPPGAAANTDSTNNTTRDPGGFLFPVHNRREVVSVALEESVLIGWSNLGMTHFELCAQSTNRGVAALQLEPRPDVEEATSAGTIRFGWIANADLPEELDSSTPASTPHGGKAGSHLEEVDLITDTYATYVDIELSLGVSLVSRNPADNVAVEEGYFYVGGLKSMASVKHAGEMDVELLMSKMQLDNQRGSAIFPVVFSTPEVEGDPDENTKVDSANGGSPRGSSSHNNSKTERPAESSFEDRVPDEEGSPTGKSGAGPVATVGSVRSFTALQRISRTRAREDKGKVARFLHVALVRANSGEVMVKTSYAGVCLQEMTITLDDVFIEHLLDVFPKSYFDAAIADFAGQAAAAAGLTQPLTADATVATEKRLYCQALQIHPLLLYFTFLAAAEGQGHSALVVLRTVGMAIQSVDRATIKVNALLLDQPFGRVSEVVGLVQMHFVRQAIMEAYKVVGAIDFIGNPVTLLTNIADGIVDLFYEPAVGLVVSPTEFARGIGRGVKSLAKKTVYGVSSTVKGVTGAVANAAAVATFDEDWQRERRRRMRRRPKHIGDGLMMAAGHLGRGLRDGVTGVFLKPIEGARKEGVKGFFKGVGKGLVGLVMKPVVGAFDMVSAGADAVRMSMTDENRRMRIRPPRPLGPGAIRQYNFEEARVFEYLIEANSGKYGDDTMLWYCASGKDTYVVTNHRVVCLQGMSEAFRWSAAYHAIAKIKERLIDSQGKPLAITDGAAAPTANDPFAAHDSEFAASAVPPYEAVELVICIARWIPLPFSEFSEVVVRLETIAEANAMLYHMKTQHPPLALELRYTSPARNRDDLALLALEAGSRAGETAQDRLASLQDRAATTRDVAAKRDVEQKEARSCCASCCCVM